MCCHSILNPFKLLAKRAILVYMSPSMLQKSDNSGILLGKISIKTNNHFHLKTLMRLYNIVIKLIIMCDVLSFDITSS